MAAKALPTDVISMVKADGGKHVVEAAGGCKLTLKVKGDVVTVTDETGGVAPRHRRLSYPVQWRDPRHRQGSSSEVNSSRQVPWVSRPSDLPR